MDCLPVLQLVQNGWPAQASRWLRVCAGDVRQRSKEAQEANALTVPPPPRRLLREVWPRRQGKAREWARESESGVSKHDEDATERYICDREMLCGDLPSPRERSLVVPLPHPTPAEHPRSHGGHSSTGSMRRSISGRAVRRRCSRR